MTYESEGVSRWGGGWLKIAINYNKSRILCQGASYSLRRAMGERRRLKPSGSETESSPAIFPMFWAVKCETVG